MIANPSKFQVIFPGTEGSISVSMGSETLQSTREVKLLGVIIDSRLTFYPHVKAICSKASARIKAFMRIRRYLTLEQSKLLYNAYIKLHYYSHETSSTFGDRDFQNSALQ